MLLGGGTQYIDDKEIFERVAQVAFDREDLSDLLDEDKSLIYLCVNKFVIPLRETHKTYIGVGKAIAIIGSNKIVDFDALNIEFKKVIFDDNYQKILDAALPQKLFDEREAAFDACVYSTALEKYKQAADLGYARIGLFPPKEPYVKSSTSPCFHRTGSFRL